MALGNIIARLSVELGLNTAAFEKGAQKGSKQAKDLGDRMEAMGRRVGASMRTVVLSAAALGAALGTMVVKSLNSVKEMKQIADAASTNVVKFQEMAFAAKSVGIAQEQLGDIIRDSKEKMGEFLATGSGEMKDFFDNIAPKIGVTRDAFKDLSGDEGLQLYYDSLVKAGLGEKEIIFYMEALANDASKLIPLLRNNGAEMNRLAAEARALGLVLDEDVVANSVAASKAMDTLWGVLSANVTSFIANNAKAIEGLANQLIKLAQVAVTAAQKIAHALGVSEEAAAQNSYSAHLAESRAILRQKNIRDRATADRELKRIIGERYGISEVPGESYLGGLVTSKRLKYTPKAAPAATDTDNAAGLPDSTFGGGTADAARKTGSAAKEAKPEVDKLAEALDRLFPEEEQLRRLKEVRRLLDDGLTGGRLTQARYEDASRRLAFGGEAKEPGFLSDFFGEGTLADAMPKMQLVVGRMGQVTATWGDNVKEAADLAKTSMADAAEGIAQSLSNLGNAFRGGGILDILSGVLGMATQLGSVGLFGKSIQTNLTRIPAYAGGTNFHRGGLALVGERGPELVNMPRGSQVYPNGTGPGSRVEIVPSAYFDVVVDGRAAGVAAPMAVASGMQARGAARSDVAHAARRRIPGR